VNAPGMLPLWLLQAERLRLETERRRLELSLARDRATLEILTHLDPRPATWPPTKG